MEARLELLGGENLPDELDSLHKWLSNQHAFRGRLRIEWRPLQPGQMGGLAEALAVGLGSGGALAMLASSVSVWLQQRRSKLTVKIVNPDGSSHEITASGLAADTLATKFEPKTENRTAWLTDIVNPAPTHPQPRNTKHYQPNKYEYQVYLCHSSQDKDIVRHIRDQLEQNDIRCWFDENHMPAGHSARRKMEEGLTNSRYLLVCASANLPAALWANQEIDAVLHLDVESRAEPKVLVLKLNEDSAEKSIPPLLRGKRWLEYQRPGDFDQLVELLKRPSCG
jgi:hypothetical protein